jgi:ABC-type dipeptide/oligopeptide/nickel transport system permease subunit
MIRIRRAAILLLVAIALSGLFAGKLAPYPYDRQDRQAIDAPPDSKFVMGTDDVGRDRFSRLLWATGVSALLAPAAALCSIAIALMVSSLTALGRPALNYSIDGFTTI